MTPRILENRALNRALLARQGLLRRLQEPIVEAVERVGAVQAQYAPALAVALWSRVEAVGPDTVRLELEQGRLVVGTLLRRTLHMVSARQHPLYAAVSVAGGAEAWHRGGGDPGPGAEALRAELTDFAGAAPRSPEQVVAWIEDWVRTHPGALTDSEVEAQRRHGWRPFRTTTTLVRAPIDGRWATTRLPDGVSAAPRADTGQPSADEASRRVLLGYLAAFGPAGAEDIAQWIGWRITAVRALLRTNGDALTTFSDTTGRVLYDLPDAPRPDASHPAPVRLLPWFDSALLAYAPKFRDRVLPPEYRDIVYAKANLQLKPTFLVDGSVAGTWSLDRRGRGAVRLTLCPLTTLTGPVRDELAAEADRLLPVCAPEATTHSVAFEG